MTHAAPIAYFGIIVLAREDRRLADIMAKRIVSLDYARAFAILSVVTMHASECAPLFHQVGPGFGPQQLLTSLLSSVGRLGVPIFLMLTGALLLARDYTPPGL